MGVLSLVARLALRDLRRRPAEALLLVIAIAATTTTLTLGLTVRGAAQRPWDRTRTVTAGPDAVATGASTADLTALAHAPGVAVTAGPYPVTTAGLRVRDLRITAVVQGRDIDAGPVDRPRLTAGTWVRHGGLVVERAFAHALHVRPGEEVTLAGRRLRIAGIAVTAARVPYPSATPGLVWATRADLRWLGRPVTSQVMPLRLADPASAPAFAAAHPNVRSAQDVAAYATAELHLVNVALLTGTWALALLAVACVTVLVGGRLAGRARRAGTFKAVGATPGFVAVLMLAEHVVLALAATVAGLAAGRLAAPLLVRPSSGLLDAGHPAVTPLTAAIVAAVAVTIAGSATVLPAIRGARTSTVRALTGPSRAPRRSPRLIALSARLPVPFLLGVRLAARRPRRAVLAMSSLALTVAMVVAAIAMHADLTRKPAGLRGGASGRRGAGHRRDPVRLAASGRPVHPRRRGPAHGVLGEARLPPYGRRDSQERLTTRAGPRPDGFGRTGRAREGPARARCVRSWGVRPKRGGHDAVRRQLLDHVHRAAAARTSGGGAARRILRGRVLVAVAGAGPR